MPPSRYYTGQRVDSNTLEPSQATTFIRFVQNHLHAPVRVNISKAEFRSSPKEQQKSIKKVGYFVPGVIPSCERKQVNVTAVNLICLDIDNSRDAVPFITSPDLLSTQLAPYNFAAYTTISSTPEAPRIRIVVDAEALPPSIYGNAVRTICARIGVEVTRESLLPHQPMFLPTVFSDTDPDTEHPVFATRLDGKAFECADLGDIGSGEPVETVTPRKLNQEPSIDDLAFLRAPVAEITLPMMEDALKHLDPNCSYFEWLDVAFALKHQFGHTQDAEAYALFCEWSEGSNNSASEQEMHKKWVSASQHPEGRAPITIRTLIKRASAAGWKGAEEAARITSQAVETWMMEATELELETEGPKRIAALPLLNKVSENRLINMLVKTLKDRFEIVVKATVIEKEIKKARVLLNPQPKIEKEDQWPEPFRGVCYVTNPGKFYHCVKQESYTPEAFDIAFGRFLLPVNDDGEKDPNKPTIKPRDFVTNRLKCVTAYDFTYDPSQPNNTFIEEDGHTFVNTYSDSGYPRAIEEGSEEAGEVILDHLHRLIKEPEYRQHVMDWMAFIVQNPGAKIRHGLVIQGAKGCGKTVLANLLAAMIGFNHLKMVDNSTLSKGWTEWAVGAQVVVLEEFKVNGHNRHEVMELLKPFISNDTIPINQRNTATRTWRNRTNYMLFTNHEDGLVVTDDERRYFLVESRIQTKEQKKEWLPEGYFQKLFDLIKDKAGELRYFFEHWEISAAFDPNGDAPRTKYLDALVKACANDDVAAVRQLIEDGNDPLIQHDLIGLQNLRNRLAVEGYDITGQRLGRILKAEKYSPVDQRIMIDGQRQVYYRKAGYLNGTTDIAAVVRERSALPSVEEKRV